MFAEQVKRHFSYLVSDYGFHVTREEETGIEYLSDVCKVEVCLDYQCVVVLLSSTEPQIIRRTRAELLEVIRHRDPGSMPAVPEAPDAYRKDPDGSRERQLAAFAPLLRQYCDDMLRGDFSAWKNRRRW